MHFVTVVEFVHVWLQYVKDSKRFVPELVNFLSSGVGCFSNSGKCKSQSVQSHGDHVITCTGVYLPPFTSKPKFRGDLAVLVEPAESVTGTTL